MQREIKHLHEWLEKNPDSTGKAREVLTALSNKVLSRFGSGYSDEDRRIHCWK